MCYCPGLFATTPGGGDECPDIPALSVPLTYNEGTNEWSGTYTITGSGFFCTITFDLLYHWDGSQWLLDFSSKCGSETDRPPESGGTNPDTPEGSVHRGAVYDVTTCDCCETGGATTTRLVFTVTA